MSRRWLDIFPTCICVEAWQSPFNGYASASVRAMTDLDTLDFTAAVCVLCGSLMAPTFLVKIGLMNLVVAALLAIRNVKSPAAISYNGMNRHPALDAV